MMQSICIPANPPDEAVLLLLRDGVLSLSLQAEQTEARAVDLMRQAVEGYDARQPAVTGVQWRKIGELPDGVPVYGREA